MQKVINLLKRKIERVSDTELISDLELAIKYIEEGIEIEEEMKEYKVSKPKFRIEPLRDLLNDDIPF